MKSTFLSFVFLLVSFFNFSQNFTWMKGSNTSGLVGVYGTMGVPAPGNNPGGRHGCGTWIDAQGNLWLFGGEGYSTSSTMSWLSDLWKYDINTGQWVWVRGSSGPNAVGVYGTQGIAAPGNDPGAREFMTTWTDASGNFWLFGGDGFASNTTFGRLGDLWKYNPTTNQWAFMTGFNTVMQNGIYGTMGTPSVTNMPGTRYGAASWNSGNYLYLFGGRGLPATGGQGHLNDLWRFDLTTFEWTWIHGTNMTFQNGLYGTLSVSSPTNMPGGRYFSTFAQDNSGNFYMFGGLGLPVAPGTPGYLNDVWRYNPGTNSWTWLAGVNQINMNTTYGALGVPGAANSPGGRYSAAGWTDPAGNFWMFGGHGIDSNTQTIVGNLNDVWKFNTTTSQWTWMKGANVMNVNGIYGTVGVTSASDMPGSRQYNTRWTGSNGTFWLFGGEGLDATNTSTDHMNDLWGYSVPCNPDSLAITTKSVCSGATLTVTAYNTFSSSVLWYNSATGGSSVGSGSVYVTPPLTAVSGQSVYNYYAESNSCSFKPRTNVSVTVQPLPNITVAGPTQACIGSVMSFTATGASTYTWNTNSNVSTATAIATGSVYTAYVLGTNSVECENSTNFSVTVNPLPLLGIAPSKTIFCNNIGLIPTFSASGAVSYTWNANVTGNNFTPVQPSGSQTITLTGVDGNGCENKTSLAVKWFICDGFAENSAINNFRVYPNPSNGSFFIDRSIFNESFMLRIISSDGQEVFEKNYTETEKEIHCDLPPAFYLLKITSGNQTFSGRILIE
jgi:N-acetylneuraminic acid mutarotase